MSARPLRVLLVDDERLARAEMRRLLGAHAVEVVGEAADADEARAALAALAPDLVFLDVQMPGESGLEWLASLDAVPPAVVFTTAFDQYALDAFRVNALDYLLKPVDPARLAEALARVPAPADAPAEAPAGGLLGADDRVFVRDGERLSYVRIGDVRLVESEGNYARLVTARERPLVLRSLNQLEARLDPGLFFRASRQHLVNLRSVVRVEDGLAGRLVAVLDGGELVELSRRQAQRFRDRMSL